MPATPNAAGGFPLVFLVFFLLPAAWIAGIIYIGSTSLRRLAFWTLPFVLFYVGLILAVTVVSKYVGRYQLTVQFTDSQHQPLAGLPVTFDSIASGDGLGRYADPVRGSIATDTEGRLSLTTHHAHAISFRVRRADHKDATLALEAAYGGRHQVRSSIRDRSVVVLQPPSAFWDPSSPSAGLLIPSDGDISIVLTLPST